MDRAIQAILDQTGSYFNIDVNKEEERKKTRENETKSIAIGRNTE